MKIVILAAGLGSRLRQGVSETPKPLTRLSDGQTIMEKQISNIATYFDLDDVIVVVGYKMSLIMEEFSNLSFVYNQDFSTNNTSKSLLKALKKVKGEPVLWLNGDVVFDSILFDDLKESINTDKSFVCVNNSKVSDEEVKYTLNNDGYIKELSKQVVGGLGEAVGINFVSSKDLGAYKASLEKCEENDYFERGIEFLIESGAEFEALDISKHFCMEVDFQEDLARVNESIARK